MQPLKGLLILDFTHLLPGPLATKMLMEMGADVVKIESPQKRDKAHFLFSPLYKLLNENKTLWLIDYFKKEAKEAVFNKIKEADVIIEQFRPGVMQAIGLGYEQVKKYNPNIIYISITGYGQTGSYRNSAGHDLNYLAHSGILSLNRDEKGKPVIPGIQIGDVVGGSYQTVSACLAALLNRPKINGTQYIDVAMVEGLRPLMLYPKAQYQAGIFQHLSMLNGGLVNYNVYKCADGKWIALGALELKFWAKFCDFIEKPEWKKTDLEQLAIDIFPKKELETIFKSKTQKEWEILAKDRDICLSPVRSVVDIALLGQSKFGAIVEENTGTI